MGCSTFILAFLKVALLYSVNIAHQVSNTLRTFPKRSQIKSNNLISQPYQTGIFIIYGLKVDYTVRKDNSNLNSN
jgi:hypothetical protein